MKVKFLSLKQEIYTSFINEPSDYFRVGEEGVETIAMFDGYWYIDFDNNITIMINSDMVDHAEGVFE